MAPFKSTGGFSVGKLLGVFRNRDLTLSGLRTNKADRSLSASGGTLYTPGNGYNYHVFNYPNSDAFTVSNLGSTSGIPNLSATVEVLVVAGGGGNLGPYHGGAGGGGVVHVTNFPVTTTTYPISVGNGGVVPAPSNPGKINGGNSNIIGHPIGTITAIGGGGGGYYPGVTGSPGGSGGGQQDSGDGFGTGTQPTQNPAWTPQPGFFQYGNPGGGGGTTGAYQGAGGGGASEAGQDAPAARTGTVAAGYGGRGQPISGFEYPLIGLSPIDNQQQANSPTSNHYGGGGSGWGYAAHPADRARAYGGGGKSNASPPPPTGINSGTNGLGGGGGADAAGDGGHGIVVIRYQV
jgi:hypothetical protein